MLEINYLKEKKIQCNYTKNTVNDFKGKYYHVRKIFS